MTETSADSCLRGLRNGRQDISTARIRLIRPENPCRDTQIYFREPLLFPTRLYIRTA